MRGASCRHACSTSDDPHFVLFQLLRAWELDIRVPQSSCRGVLWFLCRGAFRLPRVLCGRSGDQTAFFSCATDEIPDQTGDQCNDDDGWHYLRDSSHVIYSPREWIN